MEIVANLETNSEVLSENLGLERANIYALLSAILLAPPSNQLLDVISSCQIQAASWQDLKNNFIAADLAALDDEYHRLFIGVGTGELLPYHSHYAAGCLMGKPLSDLKDDLRALGLSSQTEQKDPVDHISGIFEVMRLAITDLNLSYEMQKAFFEKNILTWVDNFWQDLENCETEHYHLVAGFGRWFIGVEKRYFGF